MSNKFLSFFAVILMSLGWAACNNNTPKAVAEHFLLSVAKADLDQAKKVSDSTTIELLDQAD